MKRDVEIKLLKIKNERKTDIERRCKKKWLEIVNKEDVTNNFGSTTKVHKFNIYIYIYIYFSLSSTGFPYLAFAPIFALPLDIYHNTHKKKRKENCPPHFPFPFSFFLDTSFLIINV